MSAPSLPSTPRRGLTHPLLVTCCLAAGAFGALVGCDSPTEADPPNLGAIEVTTLTEGPGILPDSFLVLLNHGLSGTMAVNGTYTIPFLPRGAYQIALLEEAENCFYGANARNLTVEPNKTTPTTFLVRCR